MNIVMIKKFYLVEFKEAYFYKENIFMSRGQNLHFIRSDNSKKIRGFILETRGLRNVYFIKK